MNERENHEVQRCRDYESELMQLQKELYCLHEKLDRLTHERDELRECIVKMSVARYCRNG